MSNESVGIDARMWGHPGIGRYLREWLRAAAECDPAFRPTLYAAETDRKAVKESLPAVSVRAAASRIYGLHEQWEMAHASARHRIFHVPHFNIPVLGPKRLVVTVHDLIYLKDKRFSRGGAGMAYVNFLFKQIEKKAAAVLTVSDFTRADLLQHFPGLKGRVHVTPEAVSPSFLPVQDEKALAGIRSRYALHRPFLLFVGSFKAHKNIPVLIEAVRNARLKRPDVELALVGRRDKREKQLEALLLRHADFVRVLDQVPDADLPALYSAAEAFVLPSLWEGFGLPVLEAMACGTPVLSSNRCSLPEVVGRAGVLFDPAQTDALGDHIHNILENKELRGKLSALGRERAKEFSWEKTARETLAVYKKAAA